MFAEVEAFALDFGGDAQAGQRLGGVRCAITVPIAAQTMVVPDGGSLDIGAGAPMS